MENAGLSDYLWYYGASFVNEFIKYCDSSPLIEFSNLYPSIWSARGRGGAWDIPYRGYKTFVYNHIHKKNKPLLERYYVTTLGWLNFYPEQTTEPWNYSTKYLFFDDVDYVGVQTIAYNQSMVYHDISVKDIESIPALRRNMELYSQYNTLKKKGYFTDGVMAKLKDSNSEFKLVRKGYRWGFNEAKYCRCKMRDVEKDIFIGTNPFKKQMPFIRLENLYSSDCASSIPLLSFNDSIDFINQQCNKYFVNTIDISNFLGIVVKVKGCGKNAKDAICVRLTSIDGKGVADYVIRLNFDGWREVILSDLDNAEYNDLEFENMDCFLDSEHRYSVDFSKVNSVQVFKAGDCKGVKIAEIKAVPLKQNPLINPTICLGSNSILFEDTINSGDYIEYKCGDKMAVVYDKNGNSRNINVVRNGNFRVPHGNFNALVKAKRGGDNVTLEVVLTFGFYGKFIHN